MLEVGPGPGAMTALLVERAARVVAVELDRELAAALRVRFINAPGFSLYEGDFLEFSLKKIIGRFKVVANIPYHITTPIMFRLLQERQRLVSMTLTVQKELADRAAAPPGSRKYGVLSIMLQYHGRVSREFVIPAGAFWPRPKVDSACLHLEVTEKPTVEVADEDVFRKVVRTAFSHRRKTIHNSLKELGPEVGEALGSLGYDQRRRPETFSLEEFARLSDACLEAGLKV